MRSTHTYVVLPLSKAAYEEIAKKLLEAEYGQAFMDNGDIDMHGIAVSTEQPLPACRPVRPEPVDRMEKGISRRGRDETS
jgi:hypothetical protein